MLLALFAFIVIRALRHALRNDDPFTRFAAAGLAMLFGLQSAINMAVNLHLMPAKGMTLPFISYGGSSMISLAYGMGMLLALTRERPRAEMLAQRDADLRWPGVRPDGAAARRPGRRRRHGRPSVSRRSAGRGAGASATSPSISRPTRAPRATAARFRRDAVHVIPSATFRGRDPVSLAKTATLLGYGVAKAWLDAAATAPGRRRRLRRLSDACRRCWRRACAASRP